MTPPPIVIQGPVQPELLPDSCFATPPQPNYDGKVFDTCRDVAFYISEAGNASKGNIRIIRFTRVNTDFQLSDRNTPENIAWFQNHENNAQIWDFLKDMQNPQNPLNLAHTQEREKQQQRYHFELERRLKEPGVVLSLDGSLGFVTTWGEENQNNFSQGIKVGFSVYDPNGWGAGAEYQWNHTAPFVFHSAKPYVGWLAGAKKGDFERPVVLPLLKMGPIFGSRDSGLEDSKNFFLGTGLDFEGVTFFGPSHLGTSLIGLGADLYYLPGTNQFHLLGHFHLNPIGGLIYLINKSGEALASI